MVEKGTSRSRRFLALSPRSARIQEALDVCPRAIRARHDRQSDHRGNRTRAFSPGSIPLAARKITWRRSQTIAELILGLSMSLVGRNVEIPCWFTCRRSGGDRKCLADRRTDGNDPCRHCHPRERARPHVKVDLHWPRSRMSGLEDTASRKSD